MAEQAETITAKITKVNKNGFMVDGYENWFNLSKSHEDQVTIPPAGTEIEFKYKPWQVKGMDKPIFYVDEIIPVTQVAAPAASYDGLQQAAAPQNASTTAAAPVPVASTPVPTPAPVAEPPRNGPEPVPGDTTPVLGTHAYTSLSIERQVALKAAVETLNHCEGKYGVLEEAHQAVRFLFYANLALLEGAVEQGVAEPATPDNLVPLPSEMAGPPPEYTGG